MTMKDVQRAMILGGIGMACCAVLLVGSCAPLTELINWDGAVSETVGPPEARKRVPMPPTVADFSHDESGMDQERQ